MIRLLVISDDLTGAMDTGVQFSARGIRTLVTMDLEICITGIDAGVSVLVVDTESRHLPPAIAYERVHRIALAAKNSGVAFVLKKTDSTLRGNIGSELQAVMDAWDSADLMFLPAYPVNGRTTEKGRQYVHGVPLEQTPFAFDPLEPMTGSDIRHIIGRQCAYHAISMPAPDVASQDVSSPDAQVGMTAGPNRKTIHIFDSRTQEELLHAVQWLDGRNLLHVTAGCAGLASVMADTLEFDTRSECSESEPRTECSESEPRSSCPDLVSGRMLTICGSLNAASLAQIAHAASHGFTLVHLTPDEKLSTAFGDEGLLADKAGEINRLMDTGQNVILASALGKEEVAACDRLAQDKGISAHDLPGIITRSMAKVVKAVLRRQDQVLLVIFGGDTAAGIMNLMDMKTLEPCREIQPGIALSKLETGSRAAWLVTKAGGFGEIDILEIIRDSLLKQ